MKLDNLFKAIICSLIIDFSLMQLWGNKDFDIFLIWFCFPFLVIFIFSTLYDIIKEKIKKMKEKRDGKFQGN